MHQKHFAVLAVLGLLLGMSLGRSFAQELTYPEIEPLVITTPASLASPSGGGSCG